VTWFLALSANLGEQSWATAVCEGEGKAFLTSVSDRARKGKALVRILCVGGVPDTLTSWVELDSTGAIVERKPVALPEGMEVWGVQRTDTGWMMTLGGPGGHFEVRAVDGHGTLGSPIVAMRDRLNNFDPSVPNCGVGVESITEESVIYAIGSGKSEEIARKAGIYFPLGTRCGVRIWLAEPLDDGTILKMEREGEHWELEELKLGNSFVMADSRDCVASADGAGVNVLCGEGPLRRAAFSDNMAPDAQKYVTSDMSFFVSAVRTTILAVENPQATSRWLIRLNRRGRARGSWVWVPMGEGVALASYDLLPIRGGLCMSWRAEGSTSSQVTCAKWSAFWKRG
jgi:hypothetical protein